MAKRPVKGDVNGEWKLYVKVPSRQQASKDASRVKKYCDRTKVMENGGWYEVWMLNPSRGASIILGL